MMSLPSILLAFISIAFPGEEARFNFLDRCYVIGAVERGRTNVVVNGVNAYVYKTGAFSAVINVVPGKNTITATCGTNVCTRTINVAERGAPGKPKVEKKFEKLPYASDIASNAPTNKAPAETLIYIDAGHGGHDSGAISPHGLPEKEVNLLIARIVAKELLAKGYKAVLTRDSDFFIPLYDRPRKAHAENADAFVSIHHNAPGHSGDPVADRFSSVYAWNDIGGRLASHIGRSLAEATKDEMPYKGVMHANFVVTRSSQIPSCLVEVDFVTSPAGEADCWNPSRRLRAGKAIAEGIHSWCRGKVLEEGR